MIVLDTTVLVYAKGEAHRLREPSRALIAAVADRTVAAATTIEVIQEFVHVRARRRGRSDAVALARDYADLLSPLLIIDRGHLDGGLSLFAEIDELGAFDAVLAAAALDAGASHLVSADRALAKLEDLEYVFPDAKGIAKLLD